MSNWITIKTFTLPAEVAVIRTRLESEGIECFVMNEFTAQVNPLFSNAVGGVQLQVKEQDVENAMAILKEVGYYTEEEAKPSKTLMKLDKITLKIPLLKKMPLPLRLLIIIGILLGILVSIWVITTMLGDSGRYYLKNGCEDKVFVSETYVDFRKDELVSRSEKTILICRAEKNSVKFLY
jgi:hypothetical protein